MKRLTFRTDMGDDLLDAIAFINPDDAEGLYNLRDIAEHGSDELLYEIANRLAEYEDAEEQGLLVWLPCKVGDWVYRVIRLKNGSGHVAPAIVGGLHLADTTRNRRYQKEYEYIVLKGVFGGFIAHVNKKEFGKTVFLTREEAEKALEDA